MPQKILPEVQTIQTIPRQENKANDDDDDDQLVGSSGI